MGGGYGSHTGQIFVCREPTLLVMYPLMELATRDGEAAAAPPRSAPCSRPSSAPPSSSTVEPPGASAPRLAKQTFEIRMLLLLSFFSLFPAGLYS
ncbi:unnamed protein product, partial [Iphiclides podalirius]